MCFALRHSANTSSFPVAFARSLSCVCMRGTRKAGPVRNLKERWGVGTESEIGTQGCFWEGGKAVLLQKNFEVIIKCINRQLRIR